MHKLCECKTAGVKVDDAFTTCSRSEAGAQMVNTYDMACCGVGPGGLYTPLCRAEEGDPAQQCSHMFNTLADPYRGCELTCDEAQFVKEINEFYSSPEAQNFGHRPCATVAAQSRIGELHVEGCDIGALPHHTTLNSSTTMESCWELCKKSSKTDTPLGLEYACLWKKNPDSGFGGGVCTSYDAGAPLQFEKAKEAEEVHALASGSSFLPELAAAVCFLDAQLPRKSNACKHLAETTKTLHKAAGVDDPLSNATTAAIRQNVGSCAVQSWQTFFRSGATPVKCTDNTDCNSDPTPAAYDMRCVHPVGVPQAEGFCGYMATHAECKTSDDCNSPHYPENQQWSYECKNGHCEFARDGSVASQINAVRCNDPPMKDPNRRKGHWLGGGICDCTSITGEAVGLNLAPPYDVNWDRPFQPGDGLWLGPVAGDHSASSSPRLGLQATASVCNGLHWPTENYSYCQVVPDVAQIDWSNVDRTDATTSRDEKLQSGVCAKTLQLQCKTAGLHASDGCHSPESLAKKVWHCDLANFHNPESTCVETDTDPDGPHYLTKDECEANTSCTARWLLTCAGDQQDGGQCSRCDYGNDSSHSTSPNPNRKTFNVDCKGNSQSFGNFGGAKFDKTWRWGDKSPHGPYTRNAADKKEGWNEMFFRSLQDCEDAKKDVNSKNAHKWGSGVACWNDEECHSGYCWATWENCGAGTWTPAGEDPAPHRPGVCAPVAGQKYNNVEHWTGGSANVGCPLKSQRDENGVWYAVPQDTEHSPGNLFKDGISWCHDRDSIYTTSDSGPGPEGCCMNTPGSPGLMQELCGRPLHAAA